MKGKILGLILFSGIFFLFIVFQFENCINATCILFMNESLSNHKQILLDAGFHNHPSIGLVRLGYVIQNVNLQSTSI